MILTGTTPLNEVEFNLVPTLLAKSLKIRDPEADRFDKLYRTCHYAVFDEFPRQGTRVDPKIARQCEDNADELGCKLKLYILSAMTSHRESCPERGYQPALLAGKGVNSRVELHRKACSHRFGTFDTASFEMLYSQNKKFVLSEIQFSSYLVGSSVHGVGGLPAFYRDKEVSLDPYWCATEQTYVESVLKPFIDGKLGSTQHKAKLRHSVALALSTLKRSKHDAVAAFKLREEAAKVALKEIAQQHRILTDVKVEFKTVTNMAEFWIDLGTLIGSG